MTFNALKRRITFDYMHNYVLGCQKIHNKIFEDDHYFFCNNFEIMKLSKASTARE